uniref:Uncharacterized protein n=1 Tax=viral metagenome TaxID=1070528 RepID=A0A6C0JEM1_9ZZZZ
MIFLVFIIIIIFYILSKPKGPCGYLMANDYIWNTQIVVLYNNCYSYAFTDLSINRFRKPKIGEKSNNISKIIYPYNCENIIKVILLDFPNAIYLGKTLHLKKNICNYHTVFLCITKKGDDYHFYRRNNNKYWTHKPGSSSVSHRDASDNLIVDPKKSNRNFGILNYAIPCGFFLVKTNFVFR